MSFAYQFYSTYISLFFHSHPEQQPPPIHKNHEKNSQQPGKGCWAATLSRTILGKNQKKPGKHWCRESHAVSPLKKARAFILMKSMSFLRSYQILRYDIKSYHINIIINTGTLSDSPQIDWWAVLIARYHVWKAPKAGRIPKLLRLVPRARAKGHQRSNARGKLTHLK